MTADPTRWQHVPDCAAGFPHVGRCFYAESRCQDGTHPCCCGLSALRDAVAAGDPLAVLDLLGMGGTLVRERPVVVCRCTHDHWSACTTGQNCPCLTDSLYRVVRPLPDTPEVSP